MVKLSSHPYKDITDTYWHILTENPDPWPTGHLVWPAPKLDQWSRPLHSSNLPEGNYRCCFLHQKAEWKV